MSPTLEAPRRTAARGQRAGLVPRPPDHAATILGDRGSSAPPSSARELARRARRTRPRSPHSLAAAFRELADPEYRAGQAFVAPGIGPTHGVRTPLQVAVRKGFERASRRASTSELLLVADRLLREPEREARWFAITTLAADPRGRARAHVAAAPPGGGRGRRLDHRRHARAPVRQGHPRRAVPLGRARAADRLAVALGAAARRVHDRHDAVREPQRRARARRSRRRSLPILATLIGDAEPDVQKALSWAYRSMAARRPPGDHGRARARGDARARRPTTATAPGSSATACRSSRRPMRHA